MAVLIFFALHWYVSLFTQTFFHHRYAAHKMFTMSKGWEKFFYIFSFIAQGTSYLSPYAYGALHRIHHAHTDTDKDPHSPSYDKNAFALMWRTKVFYRDIMIKNVTLEDKYTKDLPFWPAMEKLADSWIARIFWGAAYLAFYILFATHWWMFLLIPVHFIMGPLHGTIINWFAHKYGYRNFETSDTSMNLMPVDLFMLGEGFHNNHHHYSARANFAVKWFEIDPVYPFIWFFNKMGIIKLQLQPVNVKAV